MIRSASPLRARMTPRNIIVPFCSGSRRTTIRTNMSEPMFPTFNEVIERYRGQIGEGTLRNWRSMRVGPSFLKIGKAVLYPLEELDRWDRRKLIVCQPFRPTLIDESANSGRAFASVGTFRGLLRMSMPTSLGIRDAIPRLAPRPRRTRVETRARPSHCSSASVGYKYDGPEVLSGRRRSSPATASSISTFQKATAPKAWTWDAKKDFFNTIGAKLTLVEAAMSQTNSCTAAIACFIQSPSRRAAGTIPVS